VGASCTLIEIAGKHILVDAGIRPSPKARWGLAGDALPDLSQIDAQGSLDAILVTHAHTDHTGGLELVTSRFPGVDPQRIAELETAIDAMERELAPLTNFILPGGTLAAAQLHVARTVCRRAERLVVALQDETPATLSTVAYLNRLSDYLFVAARFANKRAAVADVEWK